MEPRQIAMLLAGRIRMTTEKYVGGTHLHFYDRSEYMFAVAYNDDGSWQAKELDGTVLANGECSADLLPFLRERNMFGSHVE